MITEAYARGFAEFLAQTLTDFPGYELVDVPLPLKSPGFVIRNAIGEVFFISIRHLEGGRLDVA